MQFIKRYAISRELIIALMAAILLMTFLWAQAFTQLAEDQSKLLDKHLKLHELLVKTELSLAKRNSLLSDLFGKVPDEAWLSMPTTITWYSLSEEETDDDPDTAAHGKSRPFMAAISMYVVNALNLVPGDRIAVISDDGQVSAIVVYWDQKNARYDSGSWIDIVAPSQKVAVRWSIRPGRIIKL